MRTSATRASSTPGRTTATRWRCCPRSPAASARAATSGSSRAAASGSSLKHKSILDAIGGTPLVEVPRLSPTLEARIWVKLEGQNPTGSVKDRVALALIDDGEASGKLGRDKIILEPTSGNTGIALAMIASVRGYRFSAVMPDNAGVEWIELLKAYGAEIIFSEGDKGTNGSVALARELAESDEHYYMPFQYGNEAN